MLDKQQDRIYHAENVDDMFNQILGEGWRTKWNLTSIETEVRDLVSDNRNFNPISIERR